MSYVQGKGQNTDKTEMAVLHMQVDLCSMYRTRAIITRGLYFFYPIFHCGLYCREVTVTDSLCTK